jgi:hypothetical protein
MIHPQGQIHIVAGVDSTLDSLHLGHGGSSLFHVTRHGGHVRVEGREGSSSFVLEDRKAAPRKEKLIPAGLFCDQPFYSVSGNVSAMAALS